MNSPEKSLHSADLGKPKEVEGTLPPLEAIKFPKAENQEEVEGMKFAAKFFADTYGKEAEKAWAAIEEKELKAIGKIIGEGPTKFMLQKLYPEETKEALFNEYRKDILTALARDGGIDKKTVMGDIKFDTKRGTSFDQEAFDKAFNAASERVAGIIVQQQEGPLGSSTH